MNPYRESGKPTSRLKEFFVNRTRVLWPTFVILAALSAIAATASLRVNGIKFPDGTNTYSSIYNVKSPDFGCVGDGVADDTSCIQAAVNACTSGTVYLPAGTYKITSSITIAAKTGIRFVGAGKRSTHLVYSGAAGVMLDIQGVRESTFSDFSLLGNSGTSDTTGIKYNGVSPNTSQNNSFERLYFENYFSYGIRIGQVAFQCSETEYRSIEFYHCNTAVSIEDANAVNHNLYNCNFRFGVNGITSTTAGTGGGFNMFGCGFAANTGVDIQNFPSSRGTVIDGVWSEGDATFLQMPIASTGSTVTLNDCSVNGSTIAGPHIRVGPGALNIIGGKYTGQSGGNFQIDVGSALGYPANINVSGTIFRDGNPFTGANIGLASIRLMGVKYAAIGADTGDLIGPQGQLADTAGLDLVFTGGKAGVVSAAGGKNAGAAKLVGAPGVAGTAGLAAGPGGDVWGCLAGTAGANNGGGGANGGSCQFQVGAGTGAGGPGTYLFRDSSGAVSLTLNPSGVTYLFPATTNAKSLGGSSNYWSNIFAARQTALGQTIAAASSITINPASGSKVRINLSSTAITSLTYTAGNDGEQSTVCVAEDATGTRTIPTTWTNVRFAGGSYTATATANKIDCINFRFDSTAAAWLETSRAMNQ